MKEIEYYCFRKTSILKFQEQMLIKNKLNYQFNSLFRKKKLKFSFYNFMSENLVFLIQLHK